MHLALSVVYTGGALVAAMPWPLLLLPFVVAIVHVSVIRLEEHHLMERFPADYARYCQRVRRWL